LTCNIVMSNKFGRIRKYIPNLIFFFVIINVKYITNKNFFVFFFTDFEQVESS
jgi:hypothetical protein